MAHELGHWKLWHTIKMLIVSQLQTLFLMFLFGFALHFTPLYNSFGFADKPVIIGFILFGFIYAPIGQVINFAMNAMSRLFEFKADSFAVSLGFGEKLRSGLIKIQKENKGTYCPDWLYSAYHFSHPPLMERLSAIDDGIKSKKD